MMRLVRKEGECAGRATLISLVAICSIALAGQPRVVQAKEQSITLLKPATDYVFYYNSSALLPDASTMILAKVRVWEVERGPDWQEIAVQPLATKTLELATLDTSTATLPQQLDEVKGPVPWFSFKQRQTGGIDKVYIEKDQVVHKMTKLQLAVSDLLEIGLSVNINDDEWFNQESSDTKTMRREGDVTTVTMTTPPTADTPHIVSHTQTTTLVFNSAADVMTSLHTTDSYSLPGSKSGHPVPLHMQVRAVHDLTLLEAVPQTGGRSSGARFDKTPKPEAVSGYQIKDLENLEADYTVLPSLKSCLPVSPLSQRCEDLLRDAVWKLSADQLESLIVQLPAEKASSIVPEIMSHLVRSSAYGSQVACSRLLLPPVTELFPVGSGAKQLLEDALFHWAGLTQPQQELVDGLVKSCTGKSPLLDDSSLRHQCLLTLGAMAGHLLDDSRHHARGNALLEILHSQLDNHLKTGGRDADDTDAALHAVTNAGSADSFRHMVKAVDELHHSPHLQRLAIHSLAALPHEKVGEELSRIASSEHHHRQVRSAAQQYLHGEDSRSKRQVSGVFGTPAVRTYRSASPSVNWHNEVGSEDIGASFGSSTTSNISQSVDYYRSTVNIDIETKSWVQGQLGYIGKRSDLVEIRASATGSLTYNRDIMKDYRYGRVQARATDFDAVYSLVAGNLSSSLQSLVSVTAAAGKASTLVTVFDTPVATLSAGANARADLHKEFVAIVGTLGRYTGNASAPISGAMGELQAVYDIWETVSQVFDILYQGAIVQLSTDLPCIAAEWASNVDAMLVALARLHQSPQQSIDAMSFFNIRIRAHIKDSELLLRGAQSLCRQSRAANCSLLLSSEASQLKTAMESIHYWISVLESSLRKSSDMNWQLALNSTMIEMRDQLVPWLTKVAAQVSTVQSGMQTLFSVVSTMQSQSLKLNQAIEDAESEHVRITGLKFHRSFPNRLRSCGSKCGCSQYPFPLAGVSGIPLAAAAGSQVVAPVTGILQAGTSNTSVVLTPTGLTASFMTITLSNVVLLPLLAGTQQLVQAGTTIATVAAQTQCAAGSSDFIHVACMSLQGSLDPSHFLSDSSSGASVAEDGTNTGKYLIYVRSKERRNAPLTESLQLRNTSVARSSRAIAVPSLPTGPSSAPVLSPDQTALSQQLTDYNFYRKVSKLDGSSLPESLWPAMNTDLADLVSAPRPHTTLPSSITKAATTTVGGLQQNLQQARLAASSATLATALDMLVTKRNQLTCEHLPTASVAHLRQTLELLGLATTGTRDEMLTRLRGGSNPDCSGLSSGIPSGAQSVYQFNSDCNSATICVDIVAGFESTVLPFNFQYRQASASSGSATVSLGDWTQTISFNPAAGHDQRYFTQLLIQQMEIHVSVTILSPLARVSFRIDLCSLGGSPCQTYRSILSLATVSATSTQPGPVDTSALLLWPVARLQSELAFYQLASPSTNLIFNDFYQAVIGKASNGRSSLLPPMTNEFLAPSRIFTSTASTYHSGLVNFFEERVSLRVGAIPLDLVFGVSGHINVSLSWSLDASNFKAVLNVSPSVAMSTYGQVRAGSSQFAEASLSGQLVNVQYNTRTESSFGPLPLSSKISTNETLHSSRVVLATRLAQNLVNGGEQDLSRNELWDFVTSPQTQTLPREQRRVDVSPLSVAPPQRFSCAVTERPYRSVLYPAFQLLVTVGDDDSVVENVQFYIGTAISNSHVLARQSLHSPVIVLPRSLPGGMILTFGVEVVNAENNVSVTSCTILPHGTRLPQGSVTAPYLYSSHPNQIMGSISYWGQSDLWSVLWRAVGSEASVQGSDASAWESFVSSDLTTPPPASVSTPDLQYFSTAQVGQLIAVPLQQMTEISSAATCAASCRATTCRAFDYSMSRQECRLHASSRTASIHLAAVGDYQHYAALGYGHAEYLFTRLSLQHKQVIHLNFILRSKLGHAVVVSSPAILIDLTPPLTGEVAAPITDVMLADGCMASSVQRCVQATPILNHRVITDGPSWRTVFNGHSPLAETRYTQISNFISAHWNGFSDPETGIWGYSWCVGSSIGTCDVVSRRDPHSHILSASEWTNSGLAGNLNLADGTYYVTVEALNSVVYGGALVTTVQHSTGLVVDTTPPVLHSVAVTGYNSRTQTLVFTVNATDDGSPLRSISYGLGRSRRDELVQGWRPLSLATTGVYQIATKVPNGVNVWVRVQVENEAGLVSTASSSTSFSVDTSPPTSGVVRDGNAKGQDIDFQSSATLICANWDGFVDSDSGVGHYMWAVATSNTAYNANLPAAKRLPSAASGDCTSLTPAMPHNVTVYSTITAIHGSTELLSASATSNGVVVDLTGPTPGQAAIGLNRTSTGVFWSQTQQLTAFWSGFKDPESSILQYDVSVLRTASSMPRSPASVVSSAIVPASQTSYDCHDHQWQDGDRVQVQIAASNGALRNTTVSTQVVTVDSSPAVIGSVRDGLVRTQDQRYVTVNSTLSAHWQATDGQSGVAWYEVTVQRLQHGTRMQVWPVSPMRSERLNASTEEFSTDALSLTDGSHYTVALSVMNGAGLLSHAESSGVTVDTVRPTLRNMVIYSTLPAGLVAAGKDGNGHIVLSDANSLAVSFDALDSHSGIAASLVRIHDVSTSTPVTAKGSVNGFVDFKHETSGLLEQLSLQLGDALTGPFYRVIVETVDNAGLKSEQLISDLIRVIANDTAGVVLDGGDAGQDIDYQSDDSVLTATFRDFTALSCDIEHVQWAASTQRDDAEADMSFTRRGLTVTATSARQVAGHVHAPMDNLQGKRFYMSVRVLTACGTVLEASSDGVLVDSSPPSVTLTAGGSPSPTNAASPHYSADSSISLGKWQKSDGESAIEKTDVSVGSYPGAADIMAARRYDEDQIQRGEGMTGSIGLSRYVSVTTTNRAGVSSRQVSQPIIVDVSKPTRGEITCAQSLPVTSTCALSCSWQGFADPESGIMAYDIRLGTRSGEQDAYTRTRLPAQTSSFTFAGLKCTGGEKYYATVGAISNANIACFFAPFCVNVPAYSGAVVVDATPPTAGTITVQSNHVAVNLSSSDASLSGQTVACLVGATQLRITWTGFEDPESGVSKYSVGLGSRPLSDDIQTFVEVPVTVNTWTFGSLNTSALPSTLLYATVRAHNALTAVTGVPSAGIVFVDHAQALQSVQGGDGSGPQATVQVQTSSINATWRPGNTSCAASLKWKVISIDSPTGAIQDYISVPTDSVTGAVRLSNNNLQLDNGYTYRVVVQSIDAWGASRTYQTGGISIAATYQLQPGMVSDGPYATVDINYQLSGSQISATWTKFGDDTDAGQVRNYWVGIGTDRRYPATRSNVLGFTSVGKSLSYTAFNLSLTNYTVRYYVTVRALAESGGLSEATSNGVLVGYSAAVVAGEVTLAPLGYQSSNNTIQASWTGFSSARGIARYDWAVSSKMLSSMDLLMACNGSSSSLQFKSAGKDTRVAASNLRLIDGSKYYFVVRAIDQSQDCAAAQSTGTVVDTTPPIPGTVVAGYESQAATGLSVGALTYSRSSTMLNVSWTGFSDSTSGIDNYAVMYQSVLNISDIANFPYDPAAPGLLVGLANAHRFTQLYLPVGSMYAVRLLAYNKAKLVTAVTSGPVLVTNAPPLHGDVHDGRSWSADSDYQNVSSELWVSFAHSRTVSPAVPCNSPISYPMTSPSADWSALSGSLQEIATTTHKLKFVPSQVTHSLLNGATLQLLGNLSSDRVDSAAYRTTVSLAAGGNVSFELQAARGEAELQNNTITSILLWQGSAMATTDLLQVSTPVSQADSVALESNHQALGIQIHPVQGSKAARLVVWSRKENDTSQIESVGYNLAFDPTSAFHRYKLVFKRGDVTALWRMNVLVDDSVVITMAGIPPLRKNTQFVAQLWNRDSFVPGRGGVPKSVSAHIRNVLFPTSTGDSCDHGRPFYSAESPIITFEAAIGTWPGSTDVMDFKVVARPCRGCPPGKRPSTPALCDATCTSSSPHAMQVRLAPLNLTLSGGQVGRESQLVCTSRTQCADQQRADYNSQPSFFVTIRATNGAGLTTTATSDGVRVDLTPPTLLRQPVHFDVDYSLSESVLYQSSNTTIYTSWRFLDTESDIVEYSWSIGTTPGGTDVQDFTSVGLQTHGVNRNLAGQLVHNGVYYVTVQALNGAGLQSTGMSDGVTVITTTVNKTQAEAAVRSQFTVAVAQPVNTTGVAHTQTGKLEQAGIRWDGVDADVVYWRIGTVRDGDDILPSTRISSLNISEQAAAILNAQLLVANVSIANVSELMARARGQVEQASDNFFRLEPGRVFYQRVDICNIAIRCAQVSLLPTVTCCRAGVDNKVTASVGTPPIILYVHKSNTSKGAGQLDAADLASALQINATAGVAAGDTLVVGLLSSEDIQQKYSPTVSFISNPVLTSNQASRQLTGRFRSLAGPSFYVTPISSTGLTAPIKFSVVFDSTRDWNGFVPVVLYWNYVTGQWQDIEDSCDMKTIIDWGRGEIHGWICSGNITATATPVPPAGRRKRQVATPGQFLTSEMQLIVAQLLNSTVNTAPRLNFTQQQPYVIAEDTASVSIDLSNSVVDDEKDQGTFSLTSIPALGRATISPAGILTYTPCQDCQGSDSVVVKFSETQQGTLPQFTATSTFSFSTTNENDPPSAFLYTRPAGSRVIHSSVTLQTYAEANHSTPQLVARVGLYDVDSTYDTLRYLVETSQPLLGKLEVVLDFEAVGVATSMPVDWPMAHRAALFSGDILFTIVNITYTPPSLDFTGSETFSIFARDSQSFLSSPQLSVIIDVLPSYCQNEGTCSHSASDSTCQDIAKRRAQPHLYTCQCTDGFAGQYCQTNTTAATVAQACPASSPRLKCPSDPCTNAQCPSHPTATCRANYCGACTAEWYVGTSQVKCSANTSDVCSLPATQTFADLSFCLTQAQSQPCDCSLEQVECPPDSIYVIERVDRCCVRYTCQCVASSGSCPSEIDCGTGLQPQPAVRGHQQPGWCCPVYTFDDIDECGVENGGCSHTCTNSLYAHSCSCPTAMNLHPDARTCGVCYASGVPHHLGDHAYVGKSWCTCEDKFLNRNRWYCSADHTDQGCEYNGQRYAIGQQITEFSTVWTCTETDSVVTWKSTKI